MMTALLSLFLFIVIVVPALLAITFWLLAHKGVGFIFPENNKEYAILRGNIAVKYIRGDFTSEPFKNKFGAWNLRFIHFENLPLWEQMLYKHLGIRYIGLPIIYKLGVVVVNYPPELRSSSGTKHTKDEEVSGLDIHHFYQVFLEGVEFQGGINFEMIFNIEVDLIRPDVAWGRNGKFLDPLGKCISAAIKQTAMTINATDFIGKTNTGGTIKNSEEAVKEYRKRMCDACTLLNTNVSERINDSSATQLSELCGYEIRSISYGDLEPGDENSRKRLDQLEEQNEAQLAIEIAESKNKKAKIDADAAAAVTTAQGMAKVAVDEANGLAQAKVKQATGFADAAVLEAKAKALGGTHVLETEINANAFGTAVKGFGGNTLIIGNPGNGIQIPIQTPAPVKETSKEKGKE